MVFWELLGYVGLIKQKLHIHDENNNVQQKWMSKLENLCLLISPQLFHQYSCKHFWFQPCIFVCIFVLEIVGATPSHHSLISFCLHNFYHCIVVLILFLAIHHPCHNAKNFSSFHHDIGIVFDGDSSSSPSCRFWFKLFKC